MDQLKALIDLVLHVDRYLVDWSQSMGSGLYVLLFAIVFCETGLVVTPFLPGDSLLFAVGAVAALEGSPIHPVAVAALLIVAGIIGDAVNYSIGKRIGPAIFDRPDSRWLKQAHLRRTQEFYEKHGGKTIVIARFMPIIRTFAPFVAGIGQMSYRRFAMYNVAGAVAWVVSFVSLGYFFGNLPAVKKNFTYVIFGIIILSVLPGVIEYVRHRRRAAAAG